MKLNDLLAHIQNFRPDYLGDLAQFESEVENLSSDSRKMGPGSVFVALKGVKQDGHEYVAKVIEAGALAVVVDREYAGAAGTNGKALVIKVDSTRDVLPLLASAFAHQPTDRMLCIGITGTNGKTSSVYLAEHLLSAAGLRTGVLGTINHHFEDHVWPTQHTTPEPIELQARLAEMKQRYRR